MNATISPALDDPTSLALNRRPRFPTNVINDRLNSRTSLMMRLETLARNE
jgi:hypothetical protein